MNSKKIMKFVGLASLAVVATTTAVVVPLVTYEKKSELNTDFSNTYEGNRNRVLYFIQDGTNIENSKLINQLKIKKEYQYIDRSFVTVEQAYNAEWFEFELYSSFKYNLYKNGLKAELVYIKPYQFNSSYPIVGLRIYAGEANTYFSQIIEYSETSLNGFKQTNEELYIKSIIKDITNDPQKYFKLKSSVGGVGDLGLYAKNIKITDFDILENKEIQNLIKNNYFIKITSIEVDKINPTNLKINYSIGFNDGKISFTSNNQRTIISGFDIEQGKDDPISKVENFIKENESYLSNLKQFFILEKDEEDKNQITIEDAYKNNKIKFNIKSSDISALTNAGLSIRFDLYDKNNDKNVYANEYDSQTPMYKVFISSYKDTPLEYTKEYIIEGNQSSNFEPSENQKNLEKFNNYLNEKNIVYEDLIEINSIELKGPFDNKTTKDIPYIIVKNAFDKYIENDNKYKIPFLITFKKTDSADEKLNDFNGGSKIINLIITSLNNMSLKNKIITMTNEKHLEINIGVGEEEKDLFISVDKFLDIDLKNKYFKNEEEYYKQQIDNVIDKINNSNSNAIVCPSIVNNETTGKLSEYEAINLIKQGEWTKIFNKNVTILNVNPIEYLEFDSNVNALINFDKLARINYENRIKIINKKEIKLSIIIAKSSSQKTTNEITFKFDQLFN